MPSVESRTSDEIQSTIYGYDNGWLRIGLSFCDIHHPDVMYTLRRAPPDDCVTWTVFASNDQLRVFFTTELDVVVMWDLRTGVEHFCLAHSTLVILPEAQAFAVSISRLSGIFQYVSTLLSALANCAVGRGASKSGALNPPRYCCALKALWPVLWFR